MKSVLLGVRMLSYFIIKRFSKLFTRHSIATLIPSWWETGGTLRKKNHLLLVASLKCGVFVEMCMGIFPNTLVIGSGKQTTIQINSLLSGPIDKFRRKRRFICTRTESTEWKYNMNNILYNAIIYVKLILKMFILNTPL